ncbi:hypothetical protein E4665_10350 [Sporolactobacillus shoreae]|uniref:Uncharacterized protein n=1 Tax=Sporolactobacillus shoreae TaxID=1465501 RepID=A0A4Z0GPC6_9BACL|nr:hypothetical protein [Sporolactobacillus shoreae]TGA97791.1 hypothetical protein E4665_10350 [Sporolactobacillus shoreae]
MQTLDLLFPLLTADQHNCGKTVHTNEWRQSAKILEKAVSQMSDFNLKAENLKNQQQKSENLANEEFAQPLDEHSIEEKERAQRTGDGHDCGPEHKQDKK